jgi:hypothetical protein
MKLFNYMIITFSLVMMIISLGIMFIKPSEVYIAMLVFTMSGISGTISLYALDRVSNPKN